MTDLGATTFGGPIPQYGVDSAGLGYVTDTSGNIVSPFIRTAVDYPDMTSMASLDPAASLPTPTRAAASNGGYVVGSLGGQWPYALNLQTGQGQDPLVPDYQNWIRALPLDNGALNDVNKSGVAVGWAANTFTILNGAYDGGVHSGGPLAQIQHAAIINLQTGAVSDLNALVQILQPNGTPWLLEDALKIDDQGRIVVDAVSASVQWPYMLVPSGSQFRVFLSDPQGPAGRGDRPLAEDAGIPGPRLPHARHSAHPSSPFSPGHVTSRSALNQVARFREGEPPGEPSHDPARTEPRPPRITKGRLVTPAATIQAAA